MSQWTHIDQQMKSWSPRIRDDLKILPPDSNALATAIASDIERLQGNVLDELPEQDPVGVRARLAELVAFQEFMDAVSNSVLLPHRAIARAQLIVQNYVCFVYLGEACFKLLRKHAAPQSVTSKCCKFLTNNPVRAFRNAMAHANWMDNPDRPGRGLVFWARKGNDPNDPLERLEVCENDLAFWQALARCVAYVVYTEANKR